MRHRHGRRAAAVVAVFSCLVALTGPVEGGEPVRAEERPPKRKPLCQVQITPRTGPPSDRCALLAFEGGAYLVRARDGGEYSVQESDVRTVKFFPLREPREAKRVNRPRKEHRDERPPARRPPPRGPRPDQRGRWWEQRLKSMDARLVRMNREGTLDRYIAEQEQKLRKAKDVLSARQLLAVLAKARRVKIGRPDFAYMRRLIETIEDRNVRESRELRLGPPFGRGGFRR
jgi:hypothetical protein